MKFLMSLILVASCTAPIPQKETDIPFCKHDSECGIYRSRCGKFVTFNVKYGDYVENEFKKREANVHCENYPDTRRYTTRCEMNACTLFER